MINFHKVCLMICALVGFPYVALATLGIVAAIWETVQDGGLHVEEIISISIASAIISLYAWCIVLGLSLRGLSCTPPRIRSRLFVFYCVSGFAAVAETVKTLSPLAARDLVFATVETTAVAAFFIVPMLVLWFERKEPGFERPDKGGPTRDGPSVQTKTKRGIQTP